MGEQIRCPNCEGKATCDCEPPGWRACQSCGHRWWYAIADPALPKPSLEQQQFWAQPVELIFTLGAGPERPRRILMLRKVSEAFASRPMSWLQKEVAEKDVYSFGVMSRRDASWRMGQAAQRGCELEIRELVNGSQHIRDA